MIVNEKKRGTVQRQVILAALEGLGGHATSEQVCVYIAKQHPTIAKATVYRNLRRMAEEGEILDIGNFCGSTHFDFNTHYHYHLVCHNCKKVFDMEGQWDFSEILEEVRKEENFDITGYSLSFSGLCQGCKK